MASESFNSHNVSTNSYEEPKKDELGLSNRLKGCRYGPAQRERIIQEVEDRYAKGIQRA